ncbi:FtsQ-type POTRA domain-containing protein [Desulforhopalus vacuolatus]|uniref:cell division protein FtsQ/DivIB n=1 Tax=Desulforhopalus vacuolatus TaxID=40414 RepID=UPI001964155A|nr:FtsQ-type POTRA domain-containing protein [Desulforhopalus vacuolatus]MBM9518538.1 FtsQ-type POTRA domain-containing protein [Desulforhopalus vacuolatus]
MIRRKKTLLLKSILHRGKRKGLLSSRSVKVRRPVASRQTGVTRQSRGQKTCDLMMSVFSGRQRSMKSINRGFSSGRIPVSRHSNYRLRLAGMALVGVCALTLGYWGGAALYDKGREVMSRLLVIEDVDIKGAYIVPRIKVLEALQVIRHRTGMFDVDTDQLETRLEALPWVCQAEVWRDYPSTLSVKLQEEKAVALLLKENGGERELFYINRYGNDFQPVAVGGRIDYPVITGLNFVHDENVRQKSWQDVMAFLKKLGQNNPHLPAYSLSEIHLTGDGGIILYLVEYPFPIYFGHGDVNRKYARLIKVLKPLYELDNGQKQIEEIEYIQMEYLEDKILVATLDSKQAGR